MNTGRNMDTDKCMFLDYWTLGKKKKKVWRHHVPPKIVAVCQSA